MGVRIASTPNWEWDVGERGCRGTAEALGEAANDQPNGRREVRGPNREEHRRHAGEYSRSAVSERVPGSREGGVGATVVAPADRDRPGEFVDARRERAVDPRHREVEPVPRVGVEQPAQHRSEEVATVVVDHRFPREPHVLGREGRRAIERHHEAEIQELLAVGGDSGVDPADRDHDQVDEGEYHQDLGGRPPVDLDPATDRRHRTGRETH